MSVGVIPETGATTEQNRRPVSPTTERFLRAVVEDVTAQRLAELHLFTALRQGIHETGVAVVAVWPEQGVRDETVKHTVHTARYRIAVKGPDRGKWEFECTAEADAPLITVETVVRGVLQRSGDAETPVRYDYPALSYVLSLPPLEPEGAASDSAAGDAPVAGAAGEDAAGEDSAGESAAGEDAAGEDAAGEDAAFEDTDEGPAAI